MIGTALDGQGGVAAVVGVLQASGLFERGGIEYIPTHRDGSSWTKLGVAIRSWERYLRRLLFGRVALLHVHMSSGASFWRKSLFVLPTYALRVPVVIHLHGGNFPHFYDTQSTVLGRWLIRYVFERADRVVVLSNGWRNWASSAFPRSRIECIYNPVFVGPVTPSASRHRRMLLFLGRVGKEKGALDLIDAVVALKRRFPDITVSVGGDGDIDVAMKRVHSYDLSAHVHLLGWVRGADKERLLQQATVYVLPSYSEGLPMSVLEAMAAGLPVVSTRVGGIPEAITDGTEGFLIQPGNVDELVDRLSALLGDPEMRQRMGDAARAKAKALFSVDHVLPKIEALHASLAGSRDA